jgi:putative PIN family toxin of toxin-antitoxin system
MITAVFDCMVYLQAADNRNGAAGACLGLVEDGHVRLLASFAILEEVEDVLKRPKIRAAFPKLTDDHVANFTEQVRELAQIDDNVPPIHSLPRDRDDEPYLNLAIAKQALFLVSRDKDLLSLMNDDDFRKAYPGLTIIDPAGFLTTCARRSERMTRGVSGNN